mmetsp:Transcript_35669/g.81796  ORF Transcript_35669/g.81796 Transcript_35669/m.81796 type:complete len:605 (+) Transcript_35669:91-1905(+)
MANCSIQLTACECAETDGCSWGVTAAGGGQCLWLGGFGSVDCLACSFQASCIEQACAAEDSSCGCAARQGCRWVDSICVVDSGATGTACSECPTQAFCNPPRVAVFSPAGGTPFPLEGSQTIEVNFDKPIVPCADVRPAVSLASLWCSGSTVARALPRSLTSWAGSMLSFVVTQDMLELFARDEDQECGLEIEPFVICDTDSVAFVGLSRSDDRYTMLLQDRVPPAIIRYDPENGNTVAGGGEETIVVFTFSEPIAVEGTLLGAIHRVEGGFERATDNFMLTFPTVSVSGRSLTMDLTEMVEPGLLYSVVLPEGSVRDLSENRFRGLQSQQYIFRTSVDFVRSQLESQADSGANVWFYFMIIVVAAFICVLASVTLCFIVRTRQACLFKELKKHGSSKAYAVGGLNSRWVRFIGGSSKPRSVRPAPPDDEETNLRQQADAGSAPSSGPTVPDGGGPRAGAAGGDDPPHMGPTTSWRTPGASTGPQQGQAAPKRKAGNAGGPTAFGQPRSRTQGSGNQPTGPGNQSSSSVPTQRAPAPADKELSPEVRAVEAKLRVLMDKPIAERKKVFKELLVEYHPDKNDSKNAKEVFQHVNNCRTWFLFDPG